MNYTQNEKIKQVKIETLVVGVDIAKKTNFAKAQDYRGIQYGKAFKFKNDKLGFKKFLYWIKVMMEENEKTEVIVGMEPTGHYWLNLGEHLKNKDIKFVLVNPAHVKKTKTLDDNSPTKTDKKDARVIAQLVKDGRYSVPNMLEGVYAELRVAMTHRERLNKDLMRIKAKVHQWIDKYFPEFLDVFSNWEGKASVSTLNEIPLPDQVNKLKVEEIIKVFKKGAKRAVGKKKAKKLKAAAQRTVGIKKGLKMAKIEITNLIVQYKMLNMQKEELEKEIEVMVIDIPGAKEMESIKGVGIMTVAGFISEIGDIRNYDHPRQIRKLAGLNLVENSSGKHKGKTKISKRGRPKLRSILYRVTWPLVGQNNEFKQLHEYYTTRDKNPLKKKQSLIVMACKLIRVFYALAKKQVKYDGDKLINDIKRNRNVEKVA